MAFSLLFVWIIFSTTTFKLSVGQCLLNDCLCVDGLILCDETNGLYPLFTPTERGFARQLKISVKQIRLIDDACSTFPSLAYIELSDNEDTHDNACPRITCRDVKLVCLFDFEEVHGDEEVLETTAIPDLEEKLKDATQALSTITDSPASTFLTTSVPTNDNVHSRSTLKSYTSPLIDERSELYIEGLNDEKKGVTDDMVLSSEMSLIDPVKVSSSVSHITTDKLSEHSVSHTTNQLGPVSMPVNAVTQINRKHSLPLTEHQVDHLVTTVNPVTTLTDESSESAVIRANQNNITTERGNISPDTETSTEYTNNSVGITVINTFLTNDTSNSYELTVNPDNTTTDSDNVLQYMLYNSSFENLSYVNVTNYYQTNTSGYSVNKNMLPQNAYLLGTTTPTLNLEDIIAISSLIFILTFGLLLPIALSIIVGVRAHRKALQQQAAQRSADVEMRGEGGCTERGSENSHQSDGWSSGDGPPPSDGFSQPDSDDLHTPPDRHVMPWNINNSPHSSYHSQPTIDNFDIDSAIDRAIDRLTPGSLQISFQTDQDPPPPYSTSNMSLDFGTVPSFDLNESTDMSVSSYAQSTNEASSIHDLTVTTDHYADTSIHQSESGGRSNTQPHATANESVTPATIVNAENTDDMQADSLNHDDDLIDSLDHQNASLDPLQQQDTTQHTDDTLHLENSDLGSLSYNSLPSYSGSEDDLIILDDGMSQAEVDSVRDLVLADMQQQLPEYYMGKNGGDMYNDVFDETVRHYNLIRPPVMAATTSSPRLTPDSLTGASIMVDDTSLLTAVNIPPEATPYYRLYYEHRQDSDANDNEEFESIADGYYTPGPIEVIVPNTPPSSLGGIVEPQPYGMIDQNLMDYQQSLDNPANQHDSELDTQETPHQTPRRGAITRAMSRNLSQ